MTTLILHFITAIIATAAFAIIFDCPKREMVFCGLSGGLGWSIYETLVHFETHIVAAVLVATIGLTIFSRVLAVIRRQPATVYLLSGIFPLVPGAGIYYTAFYLINEDLDLFASKGVETFEIAGAIAVGIILAMAIPQDLLNKMGNKKHNKEVTK